MIDIGRKEPIKGNGMKNIIIKFIANIITFLVFLQLKISGSKQELDKKIGYMYSDAIKEFLVKEAETTKPSIADLEKCDLLSCSLDDGYMHGDFASELLKYVGTEGNEVVTVRRYVEVKPVYVAARVNNDGAIVLNYFFSPDEADELIEKGRFE